MSMAIALLLALLLAGETVTPQEASGAGTRYARLTGQMQMATRARGLGRMKEAAEHVQRALSLAAGDVDALRHLATVAQDYGFYAVVEKVCIEAMAMAPDDPLVRGRYGQALIGMQRYDEAAPHLAVAADVEPQNPDWWAALGLARLHSYQVDEAFAAIGRAQVLKPGDPDILAIRAEAEIRTLRFADCERTCTEILGSKPGDPRANLLLIRARRRLQRHDDALEAADAALKRLGETGALRLERGRVLLELGRLDEAARDLERAAALLEENPGPWVHLALVYTRLGRKEEAEQAREAYERLEAMEMERRRGAP